MRNLIHIHLTIDGGPAGVERALEAIDALLDEGVIQDAIAEYEADRDGPDDDDCYSITQASTSLTVEDEEQGTIDPIEDAFAAAICGVGPDPQKEWP